MTSLLHHLVIDVDGVLTDGKQYVDASGSKMFKAFHTRDIRAIRQFVAMGVAVIVYSADDYPGDKAWCENIGVDYYGNVRDKLAFLEDVPELDPDHTLVIGDDAWDHNAMKWAKWCACPHNAHASVSSLPGVIVTENVNGGQGVVSALLDTILLHGLKAMGYV